MSATVLGYYLLLRSIRKTKRGARLCLKRCRQCRIFFLTHRRNACRNNLCCPFGCRQERRRRESIRRSVEYYRSKEGRRKKRDLNQKRRRAAGGHEHPNSHPPPHPQDAPKQEPSAPAPLCDADSDQARCPRSVAEALPKAEDAALMEYVRLVVSEIEGRRVSLKEIWQMLARFLRQLSIRRRRKIDHTLDWLNAQPP